MIAEAVGREPYFEARAAQPAAVPRPTALWRFGLALLVGHLLCLAYLVTRGGIYVLLDRANPICWPFFEGCGALRFDSTVSLALLGGVYLALVGLGSVAWLNGRRLLLLGALAGATLWLAAILSLDYRLRQNQYYMFLWVNVVYLVFRERKHALLLLIVLFYFWAGTLKLNREWLSGAALYNDLWLIPRAYTPLACAYVVVLELLLVWGLLARSRWIFWITFGQVALFHVMSLSQINWFYPAIMASILSVFCLVRMEEFQGVRRSDVRAVVWVAVVFSAFQIAPRLYGGDQALHGQGRWLGLHMFEAQQVCTAEVVFHHRDGRRERASILRAGYPPRMRCDTVIYYGAARNLCRRLPPGVSDLDLTLDVRRQTDRALTRVIDAPGFCTRVDDFKVIGRNWWLKG